MTTRSVMKLHCLALNPDRMLVKRFGHSGIGPFHLETAGSKGQTNNDQNPISRTRLPDRLGIADGELP